MSCLQLPYSLSWKRTKRMPSKDSGSLLHFMQQAWIRLNVTSLRCRHFHVQMTACNTSLLYTPTFEGVVTHLTVSLAACADSTKQLLLMTSQFWWKVERIPILLHKAPLCMSAYYMVYAPHRRCPTHSPEDSWKSLFECVYRTTVQVYTCAYVYTSVNTHVSRSLCSQTMSFHTSAD